MTQTRTHPAGPKGPSRPGRACGPGLVDRARWPGLAGPGRLGAAGRCGPGAVHRGGGRLPLRIRLPDGRVLGTPSAATSVPEMVIRRPGAFFRRLGASGLIGFGESYMAGDWDSIDLTGVLTVFAAHVGEPGPARGCSGCGGSACGRHPASDDPTPDGARQNIHRHYDLSNDLFALFLDETMTYSSALFRAGAGRRPGGRGPAAGRGAAAQGGRAARPGRGSARAPACWRSAPAGASSPSGPATRGARVLTVTISPEQRALAARRVAEAGLAGQVRVELRDYRELDDRFDAICSAEMIEAVGERYWPAYFADPGPPAGPGRPGRAAGDHDGARPDAGHPAHLHLDSEVHLPRRPDPVADRDRGRRRRHP